MTEYYSVSVSDIDESLSISIPLTSSSIDMTIYNRNGLYFADVTDSVVGAIVYGGAMCNNEAMLRALYLGINYDIIPEITADTINLYICRYVN